MAKKGKTFNFYSIKFWEWWEWSNDTMGKELEGWIYKVEKQNFRNNNTNYVAYFICTDGTYKVFILNAILKAMIKNLKDINKLNGIEDHLLNILVRIKYKGILDTKIGKVKSYEIEAEYGKKVDMQLLFTKPPLKWKLNPNKASQPQETQQVKQAQNETNQIKKIDINNVEELNADLDDDIEI